jgi:stage IV sporulation protein B
MRRRGKIIVLFLVMMAAGYCLGCASFLYHFPKEIRLTEKTVHHVAPPGSLLAPGNLFFNITFQNQTASVLKINDAPLTIMTDTTGMAEMTIHAFGMPVKKVTLDVIPELEVIPCGMIIGVRINTDGVMVLGTGSFKGEDGQTHKPCDGKLKPGDFILTANGLEMKNKEELAEAILGSQGEMTLKIRRDGEELDITVVPAISAKDNGNKLGVWVRDSTKGIGTITYYNPSTRVFGALGHGIMDVDTKKLMSVKEGTIMSSKVTSVKKGTRGTPGELEGTVKKEHVLGRILTNSPCGIYGLIEAEAVWKLPQTPVKTAKQSQIHEGPASVLTNIASDTVMEYDIYIENVNRYAADETKGMVVRITDPELLKLTNGIVQGMSGSPILQNGRLVGAITHVFVQDPTKGYGIFIENMIKQELSFDKMT